MEKKKYVSIMDIIVLISTNYLTKSIKNKYLVSKNFL